MAEKCQHPEVSVQNILYRHENRFEPAEWVEIITCDECGAQLDMHQIDETTIIHMVKQ